ncbi:MAG TPA: preprotein translocase subunit SecG [Gemmatimonadaceae bacterium]|nr:preprotein translocase subunit SecG [Gemmatimonadaceae bacterium]
MYRFFVVLLLLDSFILAAAVLLQAGKGGGLAASFGGAGSSPNSLLGSREAGNLLTKASWWTGGIFIGLAFVLQIMAGRGRVVRSVLDQAAQPVLPSAPLTGGASQATPLQPITPPAASSKQPEKAPAGKDAPAGKTAGKQPPSGKQN